MNATVIAHKRKSLGGGLPELRQVLAEAGIPEPQWYEINKSSQAAQKVRKAVRRGTELLIVWGGDGTVQCCLDALLKADAGSKVTLAIVPTGTANLLASNLGIPKDVRAAVDIALKGDRRLLDVGCMNGEHFAVMAGTGFDALMIREASQKLKERFGSAAYIFSGMQNLRNQATKVRIEVDGKRWFSGLASCVLFGNVGKVLGGIKVFPEASLGSGQLEIGVVQAQSRWEWLKVLAWMATGNAERSPLVSTGHGSRFDIRLSRKLAYQIDGGARGKVERLKVRVKAQALNVCIPRSG